MSFTGASISIKQSKRHSKVSPFELAVDFSGAKTFEDFRSTVKLTLVETSFQALEEEQRTGFTKDPRVRVDNKFDANVLNVNAFGKIEFFAKVSLAKEIMRVYLEIEKRSPKDTGQYIAGNYVFVDGKVVATTMAELKAYLAKNQFKNNSKIRFVNVTPYARKMERLGIRRGTVGTSKGKSVKSGRKKK